MKKSKAFVLDASVALNWLYADCEASYMRGVISLIDKDTIIYVPPLWLNEIMNGAVTAVRHKKFARSSVEAFLEEMAALPIRFHAPRDWRGALAQAFQEVCLALDNGLTAYDNAYLMTALQLGLPLATVDKDLRKAARAAGIADAVS